MVSVKVLLILAAWPKGEKEIDRASITSNQGQKPRF
jgi:hypothetical protein